MFKLSEVKTLYNMGFAIHWLHPNSKIPSESGWTTGPRKTWKQLKDTYRLGLNVGVRLGEPSKIGKYYLAVIDLDIKSDLEKHRKFALKTLHKMFPETKNSPSLASGRGNSSGHYYVLLKNPESVNIVKHSKNIVKVSIPSVKPNQTEQCTLHESELQAGIRLRPAWEISVLATGRQSVLAGSIHPDTGREYTWTNEPLETGDFPVLAGNLRVVNPKEKKTERERFKLTHFVNFSFNDFGLSQVQKDEIRFGKDVTDRSAKVFEYCLFLLGKGIDENKVTALFTDKKFYLGQMAFDHAKTEDRIRAAKWFIKYCLLPAKTRISANDFDIEEIITANAEKHAVKKTLKNDDGFLQDWQKELDLKPGLKGAPPTIKCSFFNLKLILANATENPIYLRHDLFSNRIFWDCETPWGNKKGEQRSSDNGDALLIKTWLTKVWDLEPPTFIIDEVLNTTALENRFNSVKDYLNGLQWDGTERISRFFRDYIGATMPEPYLTEVSRKFFAACIKRIFQPGCKFDHMIVLEGAQGAGKSSLGRILAGEKWFLDGLPNFQDKDAAMYLQGAWLCEISELAAMYRSANESTKSFISRNVDRIRPPYGQRRIDFPRSVVFFGTTNQDDYLTDPTGNRRFWPVKIKSCDFEKLQNDRDQIWAEALFNYQFSPEPLFLSGKAQHQANQVQELRRCEDDGDVMETLLRKHLQTNDSEQIKMDELFNGPWMVLRNTRSNMLRAGLILRRFGYEKRHTMVGKVWVKKGVFSSKT